MRLLRGIEAMGGETNMISEKDREQIISIIDDVDDLTIATMREDGYPQATTMSYVNDGLTIYFGTAEDSQKARNIARANKVSVTINRPYDNWDEIEGLSMAAIATRIREPERDADGWASCSSKNFHKYLNMSQMVREMLRSSDWKPKVHLSA